MVAKRKQTRPEASLKRASPDKIWRSRDGTGFPSGEVLRTSYWIHRAVCSCRSVCHGRSPKYRCWEFFSLLWLRSRTRGYIQWYDTCWCSSFKLSVAVSACVHGQHVLVFCGHNFFQRAAAVGALDVEIVVLVNVGGVLRQ